MEAVMTTTPPPEPPAKNVDGPAMIAFTEEELWTL
jgi:hypothetical protein